MIQENSEHQGDTGNDSHDRGKIIGAGDLQETHSIESQGIDQSEDQIEGMVHLEAFLEAIGGKTPTEGLSHTSCLGGRDILIQVREEDLGDIVVGEVFIRAVEEDIAKGNKHGNPQIYAERLGKKVTFLEKESLELDLIDSSGGIHVHQFFKRLLGSGEILDKIGHQQSGKEGKEKKETDTGKGAKK